MRIELEHTREDWQAYIHFLVERSRSHRRNFWLALLGTAAAIPVIFHVFERLDAFDFDVFSAVAGVLLVYLVVLVIARLQRSAGGIPESWLGPHIYELREDGIHTRNANGTGIVHWRAVREVHDAPGHLFLRLDNITTLVIPKRSLDAHGGAEAVRAEIERLRRSASSAVAQEDGMPAAADSTAVSADTASPTVTVTSAPDSGWAALPRNLLAGLRLVTFFPVGPRHFRPSARQTALLTLIAAGVWVFFERLQVEGEVAISWYAVAEIAWLAAVATVLFLLLTSRLQTPDSSARLFTAVASTLPFLVLLGLLAAEATARLDWHEWTALVLAILVGAILFRTQRIAIGEHVAPAVGRALLTVVGVWAVFATTVYARPEVWFSPQAGAEAEAEWYAAEATLFDQPDLVDALLEQVRPGTPGRVETYFVGFAGFGHQKVFDKEAHFASQAFGRRLDLDGRALHLINTPQPEAAAPLATVSGLQRALAGVAQRMNVEEDVLLLFLTSHGSEDALLSVNQDVLPLAPLAGPELRAALDASGIQWRIIIISACHSGSFIPHLSDERTMIVTAAHADRSSFGCDDVRELTYFGEAFLRDAMPVSRDLLDAVARAKNLIAEREESEGLEPSEPQLFVGGQMKAKLAEIPFR